MNYISTNEKETMNIAKNFAKGLRGGELILLYGDLGAGKTVFVKGLAKALGIKDNVKSPTFNLMKCYKSRIRKQELGSRKNSELLCHIDAYRLENLDELLDVGIEDYINDNNIIIVEWAERVKGIEKLVEKIIKIKMEYVGKKNERKITIE